MESNARQVTRAWAVLVLLTLLSMSSSHAGASGLIGSGIVLAAAVIKGQWMLMEFLGLRGVSSGWRALFLSWLFIVATVAWIAAAIPLISI